MPLRTLSLTLPMLSVWKPIVPNVVSTAPLALNRTTTRSASVRPSMFLRAAKMCRRSCASFAIPRERRADADLRAGAEVDLHDAGSQRAERGVGRSVGVEARQRDVGVDERRAARAGRAAAAAAPGRRCPRRPPHRRRPPRRPCRRRPTATPSAAAAAARRPVGRQRSRPPTPVAIHRRRPPRAAAATRTAAPDAAAAPPVPAWPVWFGVMSASQFGQHQRPAGRRARRGGEQARCAGHGRGPFRWGRRTS